LDNNALFNPDLLNLRATLEFQDNGTAAPAKSGCCVFILRAA